MDTTQAKKFRFGWGWGITLVIFAFMSFTLTMVTISMQQKDIYLTTDKYYDQQLVYQEVINKKRHAAQLPGLPSVKPGDTPGTLLVDFTPTGRVNDIQGTITLYRPSDPNLDQELPLRLNTEGRQLIELRPYASGKWIYKINWKASGIEYYTEAGIIL
jgi:hypothetical protein